MTSAIEHFKQEAVRLFDREIHHRWKESDNVWRNAWAMDTLLDYFAARKIDPARYGTTALNALNPTKKGNWWDDFGWIGLASLRAAEQTKYPEYREHFLKIAINAWAYMYGPGWSKSNTAIYPFTDTDLPGWKQFEIEHTPNLGAPNVWKDIAQTWTPPPITEAQKMERKPRYSPGGVWNAPITDSSQPKLVPSYQGDGEYVYPIQNTVTNVVYAILTLRIFQASRSSLFSNVFSESTLDPDACLKAWKDQIGWFDQWMVKTKAADESLQLGLDACSLVRERVSTFNEWDGQRYWDASYCREWVWTGDQGLLLGALREGKAAGYKLEVLELYPKIVEGVFKHGYEPRTYDKKIKGSFLLPWIVIGSKNPYKEGSLANDDGDYQTGTGVFMRYLLQAYKADPTLVQKYKDTIMNCANNIIKKGFGTKPHPNGNCDAFTPSGNSVDDQMTAYVNRLSVLLLAIEMTQPTQSKRKASIEQTRATNG